MAINKELCLVLFELLVLVIISIALLVFIVLAIMKTWDKWLKKRNIFMTTVLSILTPLFITYLVAASCRLIIPSYFKVGSVDAWIGFAGAIFGGSITMLALYFTLKHNEDINKASQASQIKPYISCDITNYDANKREIIIENCINNFGFIDFKMRNVSSNIANGIKITEEYSMIENERKNKRKNQRSS